MDSSDWAAIALWVAAVPIAGFYARRAIIGVLPLIIGMYFKFTDKHVRIVPESFNRNRGTRLESYTNRELKAALNRVGFEIMAGYNDHTKEFQKNLVEEAQTRSFNRRRRRLRDYIPSKMDVSFPK